MEFKKRILYLNEAMVTEISIFSSLMAFLAVSGLLGSHPQWALIPLLYVGSEMKTLWDLSRK